MRNLGAEITKSDMAKLQKSLQKTPLEDLSDKEKSVLFKCRNEYKSNPSQLQLFLRSVNWSHPVQVNECYKKLDEWAIMGPEEAISLLDAKFPDDKVRLYAVTIIS